MCDLAAPSADLLVSCHCGQNKYALPVFLPVDRKYLRLGFCLCTTCRQQSGSLAATYTESPSQPFDPDLPLPPSLTSYNSSDKAIRYFCSTCSTNLFFRHTTAEYTSRENKGFYIYSGALSLPEGEKFRISVAGWICDTKDGGFASWLPPNVPKRNTFVGEITEDELHSMEATAASASTVPDKLEGSCACGDVKLRLNRQTGTGEQVPPGTFSGNTDLLIPYWTPDREHIAVDEKNPWWVCDELEPGSGKRFLGGLCTCTSCRKIIGVEVQPWLFVPSLCIELQTKDERWVGWPDKSESLGEMEEWKDVIGIYWSTPDVGEDGVKRGFCRSCGANIFWDGRGRRRLVDLSAGLFSGRGVKEEAWIKWWTQRVSYVEDSADRSELGVLLETGLREWRARHNGVV